jgi:mRNA-degrading endonuclease RelE of RelBE toxin-antitoxin system
MSLTVVFRQAALRNLARIRSEDQDLFGRTRRAIALLADQPDPKNAVAWGVTGVYRLHLGGIRVLYELDDEVGTVYIINIGSSPESAGGGSVGRREFISICTAGDYYAVGYRGVWLMIRSVPDVLRYTDQGDPAAPLLRFDSL